LSGLDAFRGVRIKTDNLFKCQKSLVLILKLQIHTSQFIIGTWKTGSQTDHLRKLLQCPLVVTRRHKKLPLPKMGRHIVAVPENCQRKRFPGFFRLVKGNIGSSHIDERVLRGLVQRIRKGFLKIPDGPMILSLFIGNQAKVIISGRHPHNTLHGQAELFFRILKIVHPVVDMPECIMHLLHGRIEMCGILKVPIRILKFPDPQIPESGHIMLKGKVMISRRDGRGTPRKQKECQDQKKVSKETLGPSHVWTQPFMPASRGGRSG